MSSKTHTERALIALRQRILSGAISGGERLFEVALANDLAISRTPVRAALSKLAEEGLLDRVAGGGFMVRRFDMRDVIDTIDLRGVLEGTAARLAAERGVSPDLLTKGEAILRKLDRSLDMEEVDMDLYSKGNMEFHELLCEMSGSRVLQREIKRMTSLPFASPSAFLDDDRQGVRFRQTLIVAQDQHRAILNAIRGREAGRAEFLTREHARAARRNVKALASDGTAMRERVTPLAIVNS